MTVFKRLIQDSFSNYRAIIEHKRVTQQCSYNLELRMEDHLIANNAIKRITPDGIEQNVQYLLDNDYRIALGNNILAIIGEEYANKINLAIFTHTEGVGHTSKKFQLKKTDFEAQNNDSYRWFVELYNKNIEQVYFVAFVDEEKKTIKFDLEFSKELFLNPRKNPQEMNYTVAELATFLLEMVRSYNSIGYQLFGIRYGEYMTRAHITANQIITEAGLGDSYVAEINKGKLLGQYVVEASCGLGSYRTDDVEKEDDIEKPVFPFRLPVSSRIYPLNVILYGAPGTGKTYSTAKYALGIIENKTLEEVDKAYPTRKAIMAAYNSYVAQNRIAFTTFHQSYSYEDFVEGLRPDDKSDKLAFEHVSGVFKTMAENAMPSDGNYVLIIDEINRGNISRIFGELITLLEPDKRWGEENQLIVKLPSGKDFAVPNNLYVLGTMNTADKSISLIDVALRRRFDFIEVPVNSGEISDQTLKAVFEAVNDELFKKTNNNTDLLVGHAYFVNKGENDLCDIMNNSIIPLLYEYTMDNKEDVESIVTKVLTNTSFTIDKDNNISKYGRLKIKKQ